MSRRNRLHVANSASDLELAIGCSNSRKVSSCLAILRLAQTHMPPVEGAPEIPALPSAPLPCSPSRRMPRANLSPRKCAGDRLLHPSRRRSTPPQQVEIKHPASANDPPPYERRDHLLVAHLGQRATWMGRREVLPDRRCTLTFRRKGRTPKTGAPARARAPHHLGHDEPEPVHRLRLLDQICCRRSRGPA